LWRSVESSIETLWKTKMNCVPNPPAKQKYMNFARHIYRHYIIVWVAVCSEIEQENTTEHSRLQ
jgi:hypothetical protein